MKPIDVYNMEPKSITTELYNLGNHFSDTDEVDFHSIQSDNNERIELRQYHYHCVDGRRIWRMFSVWFDNNPVMICEQAGREGDDHVKEYITNGVLYLEMVEYMKSLVENCGEEVVSSLPVDEDIEGLGEFYGHTLKEFYDKDIKLEHKVGDIVNAMVVVEKKYGYIFDDSEFFGAQVLITSVDEYNSYSSYGGYELGRHWVGGWHRDADKNTRKIVNLEDGEELGESKVRVTLNIDLIQVD